MKKAGQMLFAEYYGDFGGIFVPDSFTPDLDRLAGKAGEIVLSDSFEKSLKTGLKALGISGIKLKQFDIKGGCKVSHTFSQAEYFNIAGQTALGAELKAELLVCGADSEGLALAFARANRALNTRGLIFLNRQMGENADLVSQLEELSCEVDTQTCKELFNVPQMYAFQRYMENRNNRHFVPLQANIGPYPFPALVGYFANLYGRKLVGSLTSIPSYCVIPIKTGTNALGVFNALSSSEYKLVTVEEPVVQECHGAFCGNFTLFTRMDAGGDATAICPQLGDWWRKGKVTRLGCDNPGIVATDDLADLPLPPDIRRAVALAIQEFDCREMLVVEASL
jgi:tryptophan synthase beta subunit